MIDETIEHLWTKEALLNKRALLKLGWTSGLITAILNAPDKIEHHKKGLCHWIEHLYARDRVDAGMRDSRFIAVIAKRKKRTAAAVSKQETATTQYADWREALPEACAGMFSLNRYAKHARCSPLARHEIYMLKNQLIALLYRSGCATASWIHRLGQEAQTCRECSGDGEMCDHCGGTGVWRSARVLEFWCFRFQVAGKDWCWHQPRETVRFAPVETIPPQDWEGLGGPKPIALPVGRFAAVKLLLRWVIDRAAAEADDEPLSPPSRSSDLQEAIPF